MRTLGCLQTVLAFLSLPALLGWLALTGMSLFAVPTLFEVLLAADSAYRVAKILAGIAFLIAFPLLGWWGWYALLWGWMFYPHRGGRLPRSVFWGNIAGLVIVLVLAIFSLFPPSAGAGGGDMFFTYLGAFPAFLLLANIVVVRRRTGQE